VKFLNKPDASPAINAVKELLTRRNRHSQECKNPCRHCFCLPRDHNPWPFNPKINGFL